MGNKNDTTNRKKIFRYSGGQYKADLIGDGIPSIPVIENISLSSGVWTHWHIPLGTRELKMQVRENYNLNVSLDNIAHTPYYILKAGNVFEMGEMFGYGGADVHDVTTLCVMAASDSTLELWYWVDGSGNECPNTSSSSSSSSAS